MTPLLKPFHLVAGLVLPPRCPGCGAVMAEDHRFCADCFGALRFLAPPWCAACNVPFDYDRGEGDRGEGDRGDGALCGACIAAPPRHAGIRAAVAYGEIARSVALRLKYGGRTAFAETVARQMVRGMPTGASLLVPVPLHRWRIWQRGFNQAALIATALSRVTGVQADVDVLRRIKATPPLRGLGARGRAKAVAGAFSIGDAARVRGQHVVLIDDIHTSGATSDGCTRVLLRAGAAAVTILCWARVLDAAGDRRADD